MGIYQLHNTGSIWEYLGPPISGWQELDHNPRTIAIVADIDLEGNNLYQLHKTVIASGSRTIHLAPEWKPRTYCSDQSGRSVSPSRESANPAGDSGIAEYECLPEGRR